MKYKIVIISIVVAFVFTNSLFSQGLINKIPNQVYVGARPMAMGETFVAIADDINAIYWNPAGLPSINHFGINSMHSNLFQSHIDLNYLSLAIPGPYKTAIGVDWMNIGFNDNELEFGKNKFHFSFGYQPLKRLSFGINIKYIQMNTALDKMSQGSFAGWGYDWGVLYWPLQRLKIGLAIHDFTNTRLEGIKQPIYKRNLRVGAAYELFDNLLLAVDFDDRFHLGSEWRPFNKLLALRGGLQKDFYTNEQLTLSLGFGVDIPIWGQRVRFDYAFTDTPTLLNTNRSSLSILIDLFPRLVKVKKVEIKPVYASLYKYYDKNPIGEVDIEYRGKKDLDCTISVAVNKYAIKYNKDVVLPANPVPEYLHQVQINPAFNDSILYEHDNIPLIADIKISYMSGNRPREVPVSKKFYLYRRNKIDWQYGVQQVAAFITPEDPAVIQFTRNTFPDAKTIDQDLIINEKITKANNLFNAVSDYGIQYEEDPYSPYSLAYQSIDNILYPAQLLDEKRGDCDDLCVLFASLFENRNIPTAMVSVPGHVFLLINSGIHPTRFFQLCCAENQYINYKNQLWIPLETTWINRSFFAAWEQGAKQLKQYSQNLEIINIRDAWEEYKPVAEVGKFIKPSFNLPENNFAKQVDSVKINQKKRLAILEKKLIQYPDSCQLRNLLAITYAYLKNIEKAEYHFQHLLTTDSANSSYLNNLGNLFFLKGKLDIAQTYYLEALNNAEGKDKDGIYLNLGILYAAADMETLAVDMFAEVMQDSTDYQKITELLGIPIQENELTKGTELKQKIKVSSTTPVKLAVLAKKKNKKKSPPKKVKKVNPKRPVGKKGSLPKEEIENIFYWSF